MFYLVLNIICCNKNLLKQKKNPFKSLVPEDLKQLKIITLIIRIFKIVFIFSIQVSSDRNEYM